MLLYFIALLTSSDNLVYWSPEKIDGNPVEFINAVPYLYPRAMPPPYQAKAVQATAYGLMVYLRNNWFSASEPIMKWLQTQRDHMGGFSASQVVKVTSCCGCRHTNISGCHTRGLITGNNAGFIFVKYSAKGVYTNLRR